MAGRAFSGWLPRPLGLTPGVSDSLLAMCRDRVLQDYLIHFLTYSQSFLQEVLVSMREKVFPDHHLGAKGAHCNRLNHYLGAFSVNRGIKIFLSICISLPAFDPHGTFVSYCWPVPEASVSPFIAHISLMRTPKRKFSLPVPRNVRCSQQEG